MIAEIAGPVFDVFGGPSVRPTQLCGDGDTIIEPGERWRANIRIGNYGAPFPSGGYMLFAPARELPLGRMVVETPAVAVPPMEYGDTAFLEYDLAISTEAPCGELAGVDLIGAAAPGVSAVTPLVSAFGTVVGDGECDTSHHCPAAGSQVNARYGHYFDHSRSGNGPLNFVYPGSRGRMFGGVWYTGTLDRSPTWYTLTGPWKSDLAVVDIRAYNNPAAPDGFAPVGTVVGTAGLHRPIPMKRCLAGPLQAKMFRSS